MVLSSDEIASLERIVRNRGLSFNGAKAKNLEQILAAKVVTGKGGGLNDRGKLLQEISQRLDRNTYDGSIPYHTH